MTDTRPADPPSPFVEAWARTVAASVPEPRRALDVAIGKGRHAVVLARLGYRVFGVDREEATVRAARARVRDHGGIVRVWCADLTVSALPRGAFDLVVVTRYLQRDLFPALIASLTPGGVILYETFTEAQREHGRGPTSPDHLLKTGEQRGYFAAALEELFYEEVLEPDAVARYVGRKREERTG